MPLHIVLCEPEIPQNTGNISRTCAAIGAHLHLIEPMGFKINDAQVKRAGLDYWQHLKLSIHSTLTGFQNTMDHEGRTWYLSTKAAKSYAEVNFGSANEDCFIMFGKETAGLPLSLLERHSDHTLRIPMLKHIRSLNLSNAVAILAYEVMKQWDFPDLETQGLLAQKHQ